MLRGFRWQFAALIVSVVIFGVVLLMRLSNAPDPAPPEPTALPTTTVPATPTLAETTLLPTSTPLPTNAVTTNTVASNDDVTNFTEGLVGDVQRLNPLLANDTERAITSLIFDGLTRINRYGEPVGDLAERWVVSRDGLEYVFTLRDDARWQDGTPFTADDVTYTLSLLRDANFPGLPQQVEFWRTVEVQKLNEKQVRFRLAQPLASFPVRLTVGMLPFHALRGTDAAQLVSHPFNLTPVGTGAYQLEALRSSDGSRISAVDLRLAPTYQPRRAADAPYAIERMRFRLFDDYNVAVAALGEGAIDGLATRNKNDRPALLNLPSVNTYTGVESAVGVLIYNWGDNESPTLFADSRARSGLQLALNRQPPVEGRLNQRAILADSPLPLTSWAYEEVTWTAPNPTRATELLEIANRPSSAEAEATESPDAETTDDGTLATFSILVPEDDAPLINVAEDIAAQWSRFNMNVSVVAVDALTFQERLESGDFDAAIVEFDIGSDPDVYAYWHSGQYPDGFNYGGAVDSRVDETLERARRESNGINRDTLYATFQRRFVERGIAIPLYYPLYTYAVRDAVEGVQFGYIGTPEHRFRTLSQWQFRDGE